MNILLFNGSPGRPSHTKATLEYIDAAFCEHGATCETIDLVDYQLPINDPKYHHDATQHPDENVVNLAHKVKKADVIVLGTPLYHGSFSGLLKSALDNLDGDAFKGKKVLLVGNSWGARNATNAAQQLAIVPQTMSGEVHNRSIGTCNEDFDESDGEVKLSNPEIQDRIKEIVSEII